MEDNNKKHVIFKKVPLEEILNVLEDIYSKGADYVDIIGVPDSETDMLAIAVRDEYYSDDDPTELEDDTLNDLI